MVLCPGGAEKGCWKSLAQSCALMLSRAEFAPVALRSDTEPAIFAPRTSIDRHLAGHVGTDVVPKQNSVGDSAGNGLAE